MYVTFNVSKAVPRVTKGSGLATPRHKQKKSLGGGIVRDKREAGHTEEVRLKSSIRRMVNVPGGLGRLRVNEFMVPILMAR